ncbi:ABC transporter substrate-binding protein [Siculibacillus lacustris]|uniref:ABC transporter substrate-binding protein n=1 Tax=Siculibacillus lacustris TaxID=1549641 RepID=A0A4V2KTW5_9HYPH|nr:ABC transporter substrate-binding protein [Siculibacillus lacustris]TBW38980.1 ABC transporter substrate-binding protein [Siculibacillus lacustris]
MPTITRRAFAGLATLPFFAPLAGLGPAVAAPTRGGTLRLVMATESANLIPIDNTFGTTGIIGPKINEGLLAYDLKFNPVPQLATAWAQSADGLSLEFDLRPNVTWHDGKPFTAADVAFSILTLKKVHPRGRATFANVVDVETPTPLKVILRLSKPAPYILGAFAASESPIVAKHVYEGQEIGTNPANAAPIGTGPFVFKEWVKGSHIVLERNPNYWDAPKPWLDRIIVRFIPDANARSAAFAAGEIDIGGDTPVPRSEIETLKASPTLDVVSDGYAYLGNQSQLVYNLDNPILAKLEVRRAIAHAIDLKQVLAVAWYGQGVVSPTPITPLLEAFHDGSLQPYAHDPKKAAELLDKAGHPLVDGKRFSLRALHNPFADANSRAVAYVRQALGRLGIEVTVQNLDFATYVKTVYGDRAFDIEIENLGNAFDPTLGVQRVYWSKNFRPGLGFSNGAHYANQEVDRLLEAAAVEPDTAKRRRLWFDFQKIVQDELPVLNLLSNHSYTVAKKSVRGHTLTIDGPRANFADVHFV